MRRTNAFGLVAAIVIALAVVISSSILGKSLVRARSDNDMIRVTGSAKKQIRSDFIIWTVSLSYRAPKVTDAYTALKAGADKTIAYLTSKGIAPEEVISSSISTRKLYAPLPPNQQNQPEDIDRPVAGIELTQTIEVRSKQVDLVDKVSRQATELIASGVSLESNAPQYLYTKIGEVKVEILAEAAKDARRRADEIAKSSGTQATDVRFARMSPLQITPIYSDEMSAGGINDVTSIDKDVTAIVSMGFSVK